MESKMCPNCSGEMIYKTGDKNGKKWAGYFCSDKSRCGHVEWIKLHATSSPAPSKPVEEKEEPKNHNDFIAGKKENSRLICRTNLMVSLVDAGLTQQAEEIFNQLWGAIENG